MDPLLSEAGLLSGGVLNFRFGAVGAKKQVPGRVGPQAPVHSDSGSAFDHIYLAAKVLDSTAGGHILVTGIDSD